MGMRIKEGVGFAVLYDSTTDIAFGPLFDGGYEVEDFLDWLEAGRVGPHFNVNFGRDLRPYRSEDLATWRAEYQNEISEGLWPEEDEAA